MPPARLFSPDAGPKAESTAQVVIMSRLVYRKGVDLLVELLPKVLMP